MRNFLLAALVLIVPIATAQTPASPKTSEATGGALASWLGVYKFRFKNGNIDGGTYQSENVLEVFRVTESTAYVRADLDFFNGHQCRFFGIAKAKDGQLVYRAPSTSPMGEGCQMTFERKDGHVVLHDGAGKCSAATCGSRGSYDGVTFAVSSRRPIGYGVRLMASEQYRAALAESAPK